MALQSNTQIHIGGTEITTFKRFTIHQQIDSHHLLDLECRMDVLENLSAELGEASKNFLGETITIQVSSIDAISGYKEFEFKGIVIEVKTVKGFNTSSGNKIVIKAQSPTFLSDDGSHYASYNDVLLSEIIDKTFQDYDKSKLEILVQPSNDSTLHYSVQHNESAYNYASRLAAQYGEWFYYNGNQLIFGTPEAEELELIYNKDLKEYNLSLMPQSNNYKYYTKDYLLNEVHEKDAKEITSGANGYNGFVANTANTIFNKETKVWHNQYNDQQSKARLDKSIELQQKAIEIRQVKLKGVSDNPGVKLGNIVKVEGGRYRITTITHTNNETGDYENRFEAVTAEIDAYPKTNIQAFPRSESQTATVTENADPKGLGRVKVQFPWQKDLGEMTPWIRIVTAHAGGDKGFQFIPETGEEVLIGFEGANAEKPYMLGSLYHGTAKPDSWKTDANDIKAIRTRSGHTIEFNDAKGAESITITDINKNTIYIDTANNDITVTANETMTFNAKNMLINVTENMDISVGKNKTESIEENYSISALNEDKQIVEKMKLISASYKQEAQEITIIASKEITTEASGKIKISSSDTVEIAE